MNLGPVAAQQNSLFADEVADESAVQLMQTMNLINRKIGKDSIFIASTGIKKHWQMKRENRYPCYTTQWDELAVARC